MNKDLKKALIGIGTFVLFLLIQQYSALPLNLLGINVSDMSQTSKIIYMFLVDIVLMLIMFLIFNKKIKKDFKDIKKNHKKYFSENIKYWVLGVIVMIFSNLLIMLLFNNQVPDNQQTIQNIFTISPLYIFFGAVIEAPFVEELVFRQGIRYAFKSSWLFIIMSGLLFGGIHVWGSAETLVDLLYIIPYGALGISFAYMLYKTDNIFVSMGFHFLHNGILVALQFLMLLF